MYRGGNTNEKKILEFTTNFDNYIKRIFFDVKPVNADFEDINKETHMPIKIVD